MLSDYSSILPVLVGATLYLAPLTAHADGDSSADASGGYSDYVNHSDAVVIKVPINEAGDELVEGAEMRIYTGDAVTSAGTAIKAAFDRGDSIEGTPQLSDDATDRDSSTWGWCGWRGNYGYNYGNNYGYYGNYYNYYTPSYYYGSGYYNYSSPYSYNYYGGGSYYGYRYYYYPRY